jgi:hypothetical protein
MKLKSETIYLFGGNGIPILIPGKAGSNVYRIFIYKQNTWRMLFISCKVKKCLRKALEKVNIALFIPRRRVLYIIQLRTSHQLNKYSTF